MKKLINSLAEPIHEDLNRIRSYAEKFYAGHPIHLCDNTCDPLSWADQSLELLESWLLDEEQKQLLASNPRDVFLLYASAYLRDIGLVDTKNAGNLDKCLEIKSQREPSSIICIYGRSRDLILKNWKDLGIGSAPIAAAIADICGNIGSDSGGEDAVSMDNEHVFDGMATNEVLLSCAIRLAIDLNPMQPTTAAQVCGFLSSSVTPVKEQYLDSFSLVSVGPHPYMPGTIQVKIQCRHREIHRALKHHERAVQKRLHQINRMASPRFLYSDVIFEIEPDGYTPMDLKFSVDTSAALQLLTGNRLYSDNRVFLRELIQNSVDACHLRKQFEKSYEPLISIRFNEDISIVTVRDNGIGMDRQWIEKYFLTIGISLYQSSEVRSANHRSRIDFSFISQFGIGFLSSFLVAHKIVIKTRKVGQEGLQIAITNLRDYFDVRSMNRDFSPGTEVSLHLKKSKINYCRSLEYAGYLKTNIRFLNVPVALRDQNQREIILGRDQLSYENPKTADIDFIASLELKRSEGYVLLRAKKNVDHIYTIETAKGGVSVFQDGIFVTQVDHLLPEGARQHVIGRINLMGEDKCALSMDRNRIFWTDSQLFGIRNAIRIGIATATRRFIDAVDAQDVTPTTRQSIINNLAVFFDFNEVDDDIHQRLCEPIRKIVEKRFRDFVRIHFAHTFRTDGIPEADGYGQNWQQRIVDSFYKKS